MKTAITSITLFCALFFSAASFGQNLTLGITAGYNASTYELFNFEDTYHGYNAGLTGVWSSSSNWGVGADLVYSQTGGQFYAIPEDRSTVAVYNSESKYVRFTPKFHYFFGDLEDNFRPTVFAGPSMGVLIGAESVEYDLDITERFNPVEMSAVVGGGFNYQVSPGFWMHVNANYTLGLSHANAMAVVSPDQLRTNLLGGSIGFAYSFNKMTK